MIISPFIAAGIKDLGTIVFPERQTSITSLSDLILVVINWMLGIAGALAVFAIIYSGIMYITASGDITKADKGGNQAMKAKKNLVWAIIGVVVVLLSFVIVRWVGEIVSAGHTAGGVL